MRLWFVIFLSLISVTVNISQTAPEPSFSYQLSDLSCDGLQGYIFEISQRLIPNEPAVLLITPDRSKPWTALQFQTEVLHAVAFRRLPNFLVVRFGPPKDKTQLDLYLLSNQNGVARIPGTEQPILPVPKKPFYYNTDFSEGCTTVSMPALTALLTANPSLGLLIVVHDNSTGRRQRTIAKWRKLIITRPTVDSRRVHIYSKPWDDGYAVPYTEFWITPGLKPKTY
jgi:hypothetical protein